MTRTVPAAYRRTLHRLAAAVLVVAAQFCAAQQPQLNDVLMNNPRAAAQARAAAEAARTVVEPNLPNQQPVTDAATLLGSNEPQAPETMFGQQLFRPGSARTYGASFNPDYTLANGDRVALRMWGAFPYDAIQLIDAQGNVFLPNVGPVRLAGVRNADLNEVVRSSVRRVYRSNVEVYASLDASQPVRVFVTGFVRTPGQYAGVAAESVIGYLARAGGVDPERGSYIDVQLIRGTEVRATFNLYDFLLSGRIEAVQLQDGDTIVVGGRRNAVHVTGEVFNAYGFEFTSDQISAAELLRLARVKPGATHVSVVHKVGLRQVGEYHPIDQIANIQLSAGDQLSVVSDRSIETILVRVDGAIDSSRVLTLPYGAKLREALALVRPKPQARLQAVQLFRTSVADRQREMLELSLRILETSALTARSATSEESSLRAQEATLISRFVERARTVQPRGQVVLADRSGAMDTLLEDGDVLVIPEQSSVVMVHGEVTLPNAIAFDSRSSISDYVKLAGGPTQRSAYTRILLLRQDGTVVNNMRAQPMPGDEILVLPKVGTRNIEVARGITQILYQIAIAAKVALDL
jgi:protein involved in polysaccharide export with SLBB domain